MALVRLLEGAGAVRRGHGGEVGWMGMAVRLALEAKQEGLGSGGMVVELERFSKRTQKQSKSKPIQ